MNFDEVVMARRMSRAFTSEPVDRSVISQCVDLASRSPSAGKSQGWHLVILEGAETSRFWDITLPPERRSSFAWPRLLNAPVVMLPLADSSAYLKRYAEPDKQHTGLGESVERWSTPYWTVDASFAVMTLLLAIEDAGLGSLFFAVFNGENELRDELKIPAHLQLLGAIAVGHSDHIAPRAGVSAQRPRRQPDDIIHWGQWRTSSR